MTTQEPQPQGNLIAKLALGVACLSLYLNYLQSPFASELHPKLSYRTSRSTRKVGDKIRSEMMGWLKNESKYPARDVYVQVSRLRPGVEVNVHGLHTEPLNSNDTEQLLVIKVIPPGGVAYIRAHYDTRQSDITPERDKRYFPEVAPWQTAPEITHVYTQYGNGTCDPENCTLSDVIDWRREDRQLTRN